VAVAVATGILGLLACGNPLDWLGAAEAGLRFGFGGAGGG
jgi:hypothetical protein